MGGAAGSSSSSETGGAAGSGGTSCTPDTTTPSYSGPRGTEGVGTCKAGTSACNADGTAGPCVGEVLPASDLCATVDDEDCNGSPLPCVGPQPWAKLFSEGTGDLLTFGVAFDSLGSVIAGGRFTGAIDLGAGPVPSAGINDWWIAKFDPSGSHVWSKTFGDENEQSTMRVAVDRASDAVLFAGECAGTVDFGGGPLTSAGEQDAVVVKLDSAGNHQWSKHFGSDQPEFATDVAIDATGNVIVVGHAYNSPVDFGGGPLSGGGPFVVKLDAAGNYLWSERFTGTGGLDTAAFDSAGNVLVAGSYQFATNFGCGALPAIPGELHVVVAKLDPSGQCLWSKTIPSTCAHNPRNVPRLCAT